MAKVLLTIVAALLASAAAAAQPVAGEWLTEGAGARVRIAACPGRNHQLCGWIVSLKNPVDAQGKPKLDRNNPDSKLRSRPVTGILMLRGFTAKGTHRWAGGKIYDPGSGKTYASKMNLAPDGSLTVAGCVLIVCKSQRWTRAR